MIPGHPRPTWYKDSSGRAGTTVRSRLQLEQIGSSTVGALEQMGSSTVGALEHGARAQTAMVAARH